MGTFRPWKTWDNDFDRDFLEKARFLCKSCGKECSLEKSRLMAEEEKMFALGLCSECRSEQKFDVTNAWREE